MKKKKFKRVVVVLGGTSGERTVSLNSGKACIKALKRKNYYVNESVGIATGFLISALHNAGLVCLTHTPNPMKFLNSMCKRPANEKPIMILPVGYASEAATIPGLLRLH